ncbi:hypothetical protein TcWFU_000213 [Taenia crassiceps]|uniref:Uncharacterized protein n=1 Tax=Taenia crassiceps TaxID=6207 RepID=A0ABR4QFJ8_9CEST
MTHQDFKKYLALHISRPDEMGPTVVSFSLKGYVRGCGCSPFVVPFYVNRVTDWLRTVLLVGGNWCSMCCQQPRCIDELTPPKTNYRGLDDSPGAAVMAVAVDCCGGAAPDILRVVLASTPGLVLVPAVEE